MTFQTKKLLVFLSILLMFLSACSSKNIARDPGEALTQAADLASKGSTMTAEARPATATPTPALATATLEPMPSATSLLAPTNASINPSDVQISTETSVETNPSPIATEAVSIPTATAIINDDCYKAGFTYDGPPADYSHFYGTVKFVKEWRLQNIGTCAWTSEVYLIHYATTIIENNVEIRESGETFGQGTEIVVITEPITPGGYLDLAVEFTAPESGNDTYKVYFKLFGPGGIIDIGGGSIWFILDITPP